jgi:tetratricopeptide (TPR) repeat protein
MDVLSCSAMHRMAEISFRSYTFDMKRFLLRLAAFALIFSLCPQLAMAQIEGDDQVAAIAARAQQEMAQGNDSAARKDFEQLSALRPDVAEVHATLAALDFQGKNYAEAVRQIHLAQKLKPGLPRLNALLGLSQAALGQYRAAKPALENCFQRQSERSLRRLCGLQLMRVDQGLEMDTDAVRIALALDQAFPDDPEILYHTGRVYGSYAYEVMERLHDKAPNSVWMLLAQGEANESAKNYAAAIIAYRHVLEMDPNRVGVHYRLGRMYLAQFDDTAKAEDRQLAMQEFEKEVTLDPADGNAAYEIANMQAQFGQLNEARVDFQALVNRIPDFEQALVGLGGVEIQAGQFAQAIGPLERATHLQPEDEVAWYRLFVARRGSGDESGARVAMDTYRRLHSAAAPGSGLRASDSEVTPQKLDTKAPE